VAEMATEKNIKKVENSQTSAPKDKQRTTKTSKLTLGQTLEILSQSFYMVQEEGISLEVEEKENGVMVFIPNVKLIDGILKPIESE